MFLKKCLQTYGVRCFWLFSEIDKGFSTPDSETSQPESHKSNVQKLFISQCFNRIKF